MLVNFNLEKLNELLEDFHEITSLTVSLWDTDHNFLAYVPKRCPDYCAMIKDTPQGNAACIQSDIRLCQLSYQKRGPVSHYCHAGLVDVATPILYNDILLGYIMFGQALDKQGENASEKFISECGQYGLDETKLRQAYAKLTFFDRSTINAAMRIMQICAHYMWISQIISPEKNFLACNIEAYINENMKQSITVESVCKKFDISKNKLYRLSENFFGKPFNSFLTQKRIEKAKLLLETSADPIYLLCANVGIPDYNYFTKVFKKETGLSPIAYRKEKADHASSAYSHVIQD